MINKEQNIKTQPISLRTEFLLLLSGALLLALIPLWRYGGLWGETDTSTFSHYARAMLESGTLVQGYVYPNGYGYQSLLLFLVHLTGRSIAEFQLIGSMLLAVWLVFPAWLLYRELTDSRWGATLGTILLFVQPEFLFAVLRGTHEKFTRGMMLLCLYLLLRSLRSQNKPASFASAVLAFYLTAYAIITFNNLFSTSFIAGVGLALLLSGFVMARSKQEHSLARQAVGKLAYINMTWMALAFLFTFYAYQPAKHQLLILDSVWQSLYALFFAAEGVNLASNPYGAIDAGWVSGLIYLMLSLANWLLLLSSASIWLWQSIRWLMGRYQFKTYSDLLLWAFYGAYSFMGAVTIAIDFSGALSSNLQHRIFPSFAMLAIPVLVKWFITRGRKSHLALWLVIPILALFSILKAINEPSLSNKWLFYHPSEIQALNWAQKALPERPIWSGDDERLPSAVGIRGTPHNIWLEWGGLDAEIQTLLISDVIRRHSIRISAPLPVDAESNIIFDNGQAQFYQFRSDEREKE